MEFIGGLFQLALSHWNLVGAVTGLAGAGLTSFIPGLAQWKLIAFGVMAGLVAIGFTVEEFRIAGLHTDVATEHAAAADWKGRYEGADAREQSCLGFNLELSDRLTSVTGDLAAFQKRVAVLAAQAVAARKASDAQTASLLQRIKDHETDQDRAPVPDGMRITLIGLLEDGDGGTPAAGAEGAADGKDRPAAGFAAPRGAPALQGAAGRP
jgi:hypothetical protein